MKNTLKGRVAFYIEERAHAIVDARQPNDGQDD
jgi:hypothetical protein